MSTTSKTLCPLCEASCGLDVTVTDGAVSLIRGDRNDVFSGGYLCPKGTALKALQNDPDRLREPLIKRDGEFVSVSFDEAFAEVHRRLLPILDKFGPTAVGLAIGNPTVHRTGFVLYALDLAAALQSPNVFSAASLDQMPKHLAVGHLYGDFYSIPVPDIARTDLLIVIGANPVVSNGSMWSVPDFKGKAQALRARGGRIVTIDPRFTETSAIADRHHFIKPGADVFLLAAVVNVLLHEGLVATGRLAEHLSGLDDVRAAVQPFTPERASPSSGIAAADIRRLARELAAAPSAAVYGRLGTCLQRHATTTSWLIEVINILTGNLDRPGGTMFAKPPAFAANTEGEPGTGAGVTTGAYRSRVSSAPEVMGQFPMACLAEEIDTSGEGQIRALVTMASNMARSVPDSQRMTKALDSLDFMVSLDIYLNETTRHADVIIPGPSPLEDSHYDVFFSQFAHHNTARFAPPVLQPDPRIPHDWQTMVRLIGIITGKGSNADLDRLDNDLLRGILEEKAPEFVDTTMDALRSRIGAERRLDLGLRTGPYGDMFGLQPNGISLEALISAPQGIDFGPLEPRVPEVLRTRSGTIELAPHDVLADLAIADQSLDATDTHPGNEGQAVLIGRRHLRSNNSWMHNLPVLAKGSFRCTLLIHPDDATLWDVQESGRASVTSDVGRIEVDVSIDASMMRGVVSLPHGWGHDEPATRMQIAAERPGANINVVTNASARDPLSGNAAITGTAVIVQPIERSDKEETP